jgi:hypothetical protein
MADADEEIFNVVIGDGGTCVEMERESVEDGKDVGCVTGGQVENRFAGGGEDGFDHNDPPL